MSEWEIKYRAGGTMVEHHRAWCSDAPEFHSEWMEEEYVTVSVRSSEPVDFQTGDFITYRDDEYFIDYDPSVIKASRRHASGDSFRYDNIKFVSQSARLKHIYFLDFVLNDNNVAYSHQPKFSFFCSSVEDLADRLQANIDRGGIGTWKVLTPNWLRTQGRCGDVSVLWAHYFGSGGDYGTWGDSSSAVTKGERDQNLDVSNRTCWEELKESYYTFGLPYFCVGAEGGGVIVIGAPAVVVGDKIFRYGKGRGLYEIERHADTDKDVVTKLYAYGSEDNLPSSYYASQTVKAYATVVSVNSHDALLDLDYNPDYFTTQDDLDRYLVTVTKDGVDYTGFLSKYSPTTPPSCVFNPDLGGSSFHVGDMVFLTSGVSKGSIPETHLYRDTTYPTMLSINRLMLPGFPDKSLKAWVEGNSDPAIRALATRYLFSDDPLSPWIQSLNADTIGVREGVVYYDGGDNKEIKPTLEGTGYDHIIAAEQMTDDGFLSDDAKEKDLQFTVDVPHAGFDYELERRNAPENVVLSMKDGYCVGREFPLKKATRKTDSTTGDLYWTLTLERAYDDSLGRYFPNKHYASGDYGQDLYQVKAGDHFVVTGIGMPSALIDEASERLFAAACDDLDRHDRPSHTFVPKIDEIEMARQHDAAVASGGVSIHDTIKAGMTLILHDDDLGIDRTVYIDTLTIKEDGNNGIPTYDVVLRNDKQEGTFHALQDQVSKIMSGDVAVSSTDPSVVKSLISAYGSQLFLSKTQADTAEGLITLLRGLLLGTDGYGIDADGDATLRSLLSKNFQSGEIGGSGFGLYTDDNGVSTAEVDKLIVRMKAVFQELEIKKKSITAGDVGFSDAANKALVVLPMDSDGDVILDGDGQPDFTDAEAYRVMWLEEDGEQAVYNTWAIDDQARCQTFNIKTGTYNNVSNRYYWRKVIGGNFGETSTPFEWDGGKYNYIDLAANVEGTYQGVEYTNGRQQGITNDIPAEGDDIIQIGNQSNTDRQNYTEIIVNGQDAPAIKQYQGINDYTMSEKLVRGDYYDRVKGTYRSVVYGDFYAGDKTREGGYAEYDKATNTFNIKGTLQVGSTLDDGRDVNDLGVRKGNLLRNSGFTGEYESESVTSTTDVSADTIIYSDPFDHWEQSGCTAVADTASASGMSATIGQLMQTIDGGLTAGEWYTFSFRGRYGRVTVTVGGVSKTFELTDSVERYDYPFVCLANAPFTLTGNGSSVMELQLMAGNIPSEWHSAHKDNDSALAEFYSDEYLRNAITKASTTINGGLILSQILKVGNYRNMVMDEETGGMSGAYTDDKSPFLWGGGTMEQAIYTIMKYANNPSYQPTASEVAQMAKFVVTHGGRAILNDIILRGYIYALGGVFNGTVYATDGEFTGTVNADRGVFGGLVTTNFKDVRDADGELVYEIPWIYTMGREDLSIMYNQGIPSRMTPEVGLVVILPVDEYYIGKEINITCTGLVYDQSFLDSIRVRPQGNPTPSRENTYIFGIQQYEREIGGHTIYYYATNEIVFDGGVLSLVGVPYQYTTQVDGEDVTVTETKWVVKSFSYRIMRYGDHGLAISDLPQSD